LFREQQQEICRRADSLFASLLFCEWLVGVVLAVGVAPLAWAGKVAPPGDFLAQAVFVGGAIISLPCFLAMTRPGRPLTRQAVGVAQMLMGLLLLHLTAGRPETHYYTFASLALLAFYRDWRVLVTAMLVDTAGHLNAGAWWPESVYGDAAVAPLRWLEHTGWVLAVNLFLIAACRQSVLEMRDTALRQAQLEIGTATVEEKVRSRTRELHVSQVLKAAILEAALDPILTVDARGRLTQFNPAAEHIFGYTRAEALEEVRGEQLLPALRPAPGQAGGAPLGRRFESVGRRKDGGEFPVEMIVVLLHLEGEALYTAYVHDITERKRADAELLQAKEAAEAASRAKSEFLANVSHEVRTPLNGILGMTDLALQTDLDAEQRDYLGMVRSSSDALLAVINDLLDYSKIEAGKMHLDPVDFDVRELVDATLRPLALRAHAKGLELTYHVRPNVPEMLVGDSFRLQQVLVNLVGNAVKFTEHGEVAVQVETTAFAQSEVGLHVTVRDTGIGIPADKHAIIFSPFAQADGSTTRRFGGTGLGLSISARLVDLMGGHIWLESEPGQGSTFHFTVRLARSFTVSTAQRALQGRTACLRGVPVLVADDHATSRRLLEDLLTGWRMAPTAVEDGERALAELRDAAARGRRFPVLLVDAHMPGLDGFELVRRVRQQPELAGAVVLMLSSLDHPGDTARCAELGVAAFLGKPVKPAELLRTLIDLLDASAGGREPADAAAEGDTPPVLPPLRVLLAEDNAVNQKLVVRLLQRGGHTVTVAENGRQALEVLLAQPFDLVLMDVQMPEMDGLEVTRALRGAEKETGRHVPVVALTAHAMPGDRERCLAAGMDSYLTKPVEPRELWDAVRGALAGPAASPERPPALDRAAILQRLEGDEALLRELVELFRGDSGALLEQARAALAGRDAEGVRRAAHTLKSSLGLFEADGALASARRLEEAAGAGDLAAAEEAFAVLQERLGRLRPALQALLPESACP
jgi:PAS domain S-box-containing protein